MASQISHTWDSWVELGMDRINTFKKKAKHSDNNNNNNNNDNNNNNNILFNFIMLWNPVKWWMSNFF